MKPMKDIIVRMNESLMTYLESVQHSEATTVHKIGCYNALRELVLCTIDKKKKFLNTVLPFSESTSSVAYGDFRVLYREFIDSIVPDSPSTQELVRSSELEWMRIIGGCEGATLVGSKMSKMEGCIV